MRRPRHIGILTSGGDCAGLNALIRAVVHRAVGTYGCRVSGIEYGTQGLMARPIRARSLTVAEVDDAWLRLAGTKLGSVNTGDPFAFPMPDGRVVDRSAEVVEGYHQLGLEALIGVGGDGSLEILRRLARQGDMRLIGVPKTIDNDVAATEHAVGFSTATEVATEALDRLQPTAASHDRVMILEVMGRDAGHIALNAGIAGGADVILIPEIPYNLTSVAQRIERIRLGGRNFALVVVSEAVRTDRGEPVTFKGRGGPRYGGIGHWLGERLGDLTGAEVRVTVLGHVQRGAEPSPQDRLLASAFGVHAVDLAMQGRFDRMVVWRDREVVDVPLGDVVGRSKRVDLQGALVRTAVGLGIYLGEVERAVADVTA